MTEFNNYLTDYGQVIVFIMAFLLIIAFMAILLSFAKTMIKWYKDSRRYKF